LSKAPDDDRPAARTSLDRLARLAGELGIGGVAAAAALLIRTGFAAYVPGVPPYALSFPAVLAATLVGGRWAGLLCLLACQSGALYFFIPPDFSFELRDTASAVGFVLASVSAALVWWIGVLYRRERARTLAFERSRLAERQSALDELLRLFDNAHSFMALLRGPDLRIAYLNQAYLDLIGESRDILGRPLLEARPLVAPRFLDLMTQVLETGKPVRLSELISPIVRGDGTRIVRYLDVIYEPVFAADGKAEAIFIEGRDMTEAMASRRAVDDSERRMRLAVRASEIGVWEWRLASNEIIYSDQAKAICGFPLEEPVTFEMVAASTHPEDYAVASAQTESMRDPAQRTQAPFEYRIIRPTGEVRWVAAQGETVFEAVDGQEQATVFVGTLIDITERKAKEAQLRLLAHEVDHRSNNLLTLVINAIERSRADDPAVLKTIIAGRVRALARSHQLLAASRWSGASLMGLLQEELSPFSLGEDERVSIRGEDGSLSPQAAQALAMCVHELVTNAVKYGALKAPHGRVKVQVRRIDEGLCRIVWTESGGPTVVPPDREGFGSAVLSRALAGAGGEVKLDWRPEGLVCELLAPTLP
jgi:PAS domain S-box-containing protein